MQALGAISERKVRNKRWICEMLRKEPALLEYDLGRDVHKCTVCVYVLVVSVTNLSIALLGTVAM